MRIKKKIQILKNILTYVHVHEVYILFVDGSNVGQIFIKIMIQTTNKS